MKRYPLEKFENFRREKEIAERYFRGEISEKSKRAFEYGQTALRNAVLISGGGLISIPTLVGLVPELSINLDYASLAGAAFALSLICALMIAYCAHINWTLHEMAWERYWSDRQDWLVAVFLEEQEQFDGKYDKVYYQTSIWLTFWIPHILAVICFIALSMAFFLLYRALDVPIVSASVSAYANANYHG